MLEPVEVEGSREKILNADADRAAEDCAGYPPSAPLAPNVNPDRARKLDLELERQEDILPVYTAERIERPAAN
jgi:hypothetical protein